MGSRRAFLSAGRIVAYVIALVVIGAVAVGLKMYAGSVASPPDPLAPPNADALAKYLVEQHRDAAANPAGLTLTDPAKLSDSMAGWFGSRRTVEELVGEKPAVTFVGAKPGAVPGPGKSVQVLFKTGPAGGPDQSASLFLKRYAGAPELEDGTAYTLASKGGPAIIVWLHRGVVFDLVGTKQDAVDALAKAMSTPTPSRAY